MKAKRNGKQQVKGKAACTAVFPWCKSLAYATLLKWKGIIKYISLVKACHLGGRESIYVLLILKVCCPSGTESNYISLILKHVT